MLAPYGLAGTLTGQSYRVTDPFTRKLIDEWRQYYPIGVDCGAGQMQRGPGPGGGAANGDAGIGEGADMVEVVVGNVRMRYPSCYVLACDADNVANSAAFNQLAALEGGQLAFYFLISNHWSRDLLSFMDFFRYNSVKIRL